MQRRIPARWLVTAGLAYLFFLLALAPASLLQRLLPTTPGLRLAQPTGTLWSGNLDSLQLPTALGMLHIRNVQWRLQWQYLLQGEIAFRVESADFVGDLIVAQGWRGTRLRQVDLSLPASELARMLPALALLQPGGEVRWQGQNIRLPQLNSGEAEVLWNNATLNLTQVQPLGNYRLHWQGKPQASQFEVQTLQGKLFIEGTGEFNPPQRWRFQGTAQSAAEHAAQLNNLLNKIGKNNGSGIYQLQLTSP